MDRLILKFNNRQMITAVKQIIAEELCKISRICLLQCLVLVRNRSNRWRCKQCALNQGPFFGLSLLPAIIGVKFMEWVSIANTVLFLGINSIYSTSFFGINAWKKRWENVGPRFSTTYRWHLELKLGSISWHISRKIFFLFFKLLPYASYEI